METKKQPSNSPVVISSRQMMHTLSTAASSAAVASGYNVFMFLMALLDIMTSLKALLKFLHNNSLLIHNILSKSLKKHLKLPNCKIHLPECK